MHKQCGDSCFRQKEHLQRSVLNRAAAPAVSKALTQQPALPGTQRQMNAMRICDEITTDIAAGRPQV